MRVPPGKQQGFQSTADWPQGLIPRVQPQEAHRKFLQDNTELDTVMMNIDEAQRLLRRGEVAFSYLDSETSVVTSSTIHDEDLKELKWRREEGIVRGLGPDFHIPTDYAVYGDMDQEDRIERVQNLMQGTRWMTRQLSDTSTRIMPLVKGYSKQERNICYRAFDDLGASYCAFYGSQYFGGAMGNGIRALNEDIRQIVSEYDLEGMLLIGLQSADYLGRMPPEVVAAAGTRWIEKSGLRDMPVSQSKQRFAQWKQAPEGQLGKGDATLASVLSGGEGVTA